MRPNHCMQTWKRKDKTVTTVFSKVYSRKVEKKNRKENAIYLQRKISNTKLTQTQGKEWRKPYKYIRECSSYYDYYFLIFSFSRSNRMTLKFNYSYWKKQMGKRRISICDVTTFKNYLFNSSQKEIKIMKTSSHFHIKSIEII